LPNRLHFRHKPLGVLDMRNRNSDGMGWGSRIGIGVAVVVLIGAIGLTVYGGRVQPRTHPVEQIVPNDKLPN
jgi:hypothetical protein